MKFYTLKEVPIARDDKVFKTSPLGSAVGLLISLAIAISMFELGRRGGYFSHGWTVPPFIAYLMATISVFAVLISIGSLRARLKPSNWLLRCNQSGIIIKYRAYQNWRMPSDDVQAVGFDYSEIAWARKAKERRTSPGMEKNETQLEFLTYLDLGLINPDTAALEAKLDEEMKRSWSFRALIYPVSVTPGGIVRLLWRNSGGGIASRPDRALDYLSSFVKIAEGISTKTNLAQPGADSLLPEEKISLLARSGDKLGAIKLTRKIRGCSLEEATKHVETL